MARPDNLGAWLPAAFALEGAGITAAMRVTCLVKRRADDGLAATVADDVLLGRDRYSTQLHNYRAVKAPGLSVSERIR